MATNKHLDEQGESAKKLYEQIADSSKTYNERRKERTAELRDVLTPVWQALAAGKTVNGCTDKLTWCKWVNPAAKHPDRYFYMVMQDKTGPKSLQSERTLHAELKAFTANSTAASVVVDMAGDGIKGSFSVGVNAKEVPLKDYMPCGFCTNVVQVNGKVFAKHTTHPLRGGVCEGTGKSVYNNLLIRTVERALFHRVKHVLAGMHLWNDAVKKLYENASKKLTYREPYRYSA